jgi:hypothetical protein
MKGCLTSNRCASSAPALNWYAVSLITHFQSPPPESLFTVKGACRGSNRRELRLRTRNTDRFRFPIGSMIARVMSGTFNVRPLWEVYAVGRNQLHNPFNITVNYGVTVLVPSRILSYCTTIYRRAIYQSIRLVCTVPVPGATRVGQSCNSARLNSTLRQH